MLVFKRFAFLYVALMLGIIFSTVYRLNHNFNDTIQPVQPQVFYKVEHTEGRLNLTLLGYQATFSTKGILTNAEEMLTYGKEMLANTEDYRQWVKTEFEEMELEALLPQKLASWRE